MSPHVLLNISNELGETDKMPGLTSILSVFATYLIYITIQKHKC